MTDIRTNFKAADPEPRGKKKRPPAKGRAYTKLSYKCRKGNHSQCTASKCECECGHGVGR